MSHFHEELQRVAASLGFDLEAEIKIGGNYTPVLVSGNDVYVSGQIPRVGDRIAFTGAVGADVALGDARQAAAIAIVRGLALLEQAAGSLERVEQILRITVYVRSAPEFTQQSEVADGASDVLQRVLGEAGRHTRTSVGVSQLPKGAAVEIDMTARMKT